MFNCCLNKEAKITINHDRYNGFKFETKLYICINILLLRKLNYTKTYFCILN